MRHILLSCTLLLGGVIFAQQQEQAPLNTAPRYQTPSLENRQTTPQTMPPDTQAPPPEAMSNERVESLILHRFKREPGLSGTNVDAKVDDHAVILTGNVGSNRQRELALRIAQSNAGNRRVIDKIQLKPKGGGSA